MTYFEILWRSSTKKDLRSLPPDEVAGIVAAVVKFVDEPFPHGAQKLSGAEHTHGLRLGDHPLAYEVLVTQKAIVIQRVPHRKGVYR